MISKSGSTHGSNNRTSHKIVAPTLQNHHKTASNWLNPTDLATMSSTTEKETQPAIVTKDDGKKKKAKRGPSGEKHNS